MEEQLKNLKFGEHVLDKNGFMITKTFGGFIYSLGQSICFVPYNENQSICFVPHNEKGEDMEKPADKKSVEDKKETKIVDTQKTEKKTVKGKVKTK